MALIKCPECKKDISNLSEVCIYCGYPLNKPKENTICIINGKRYDLSKYKDRIDNLMPGDEMTKLYIMKDFKKDYPYIEARTIARLIDTIHKTNNIPVCYSDNDALEQDTISCPKCRSTQITTGARGFSIVTGFMGANKTVNRCAKCGYTWKPK